MPTGYTAPVQDGSITDVKDFAAVCARAFGAFMHQRDDSPAAALAYPETPHRSYHERSLKDARRRQEHWRGMDEEAKYAEWTEYYNTNVREGIKSATRHDVDRARYKAMIAQVESVDVPAELENFKEFMLDQLNSSIKFDCPENDAWAKEYYRPLSYVEWCKNEETRIARNIDYHRDGIDKEWQRYMEACDYIDLMAQTFGFNITGARHPRPRAAS